MALPQAARWIKELRASLEAASLYLVPRGGVILWHGSSDAIPKGWAICDGTQGTPDMRDRFVVGAGGKYALDAKGGAESATPEVSTGTAKTGIGLADAAPEGTAGSSVTGIGIQKADLNISTGTAGTGISIQGTTLDGNTLPNHNHSITTCADNGSSNSYPMGPVIRSVPKPTGLMLQAIHGATPTASRTPGTPTPSAQASTRMRYPTLGTPTRWRPRPITMRSRTADTAIRSRQKRSARCPRTMRCVSSKNFRV